MSSILWSMTMYNNKNPDPLLVCNLIDLFSLFINGWTSRSGHMENNMKYDRYWIRFFSGHLATLWAHYQQSGLRTGVTICFSYHPKLIFAFWSVSIKVTSSAGRGTRILASPTLDPRVGTLLDAQRAWLLLGRSWKSRAHFKAQGLLYRTCGYPRVLLRGYPGH